MQERTQRGVPSRSANIESQGIILEHPQERTALVYPNNENKKLAGEEARNILRDEEGGF